MQIIDTSFVRVRVRKYWPLHYNDVIISAMASQITSLTIAYQAVYSGTDQRKHQSPAQMASNAENISIWWRHHDDNGIDSIVTWIYAQAILQSANHNHSFYNERFFLANEYFTPLLLVYIKHIQWIYCVIQRQICLAVELVYLRRRDFGRDRSESTRRWSVKYITRTMA